MINEIRVRNYRSLADETVKLDDLTVFVGQNGSGKSNLIDALRFLKDALRLGLKTALIRRNGIGSMRRWSEKGRPFDVEIGVHIQTSDMEAEYMFVLGSERRGEYRVKTEMCSVQMESEELGESDQYHRSEGKWVEAPKWGDPAIQPDALTLPLLAGSEPYKLIYDYLTRMGFYTIFPRLLRDHQEPSNPYPLEEDASNLASAMDGLGNDARKSFIEAINYVISDVDDYVIRQTGSRLMIRLRHPAGKSISESGEEERMPWFELAQESDGTVRMLALLMSLHQKPALSLIALEEPELTVHPGVMPRLWEEIVEASKRSQIILTTHSPDLLDLCSAEQIRVVEKYKGITHIGPIDQAQKHIIRERLFSPGQLMQAQGLLL